MVISTLTDGIARQVEAVADGVSSVFEPVVRLGVTGLARSGKTVFITSLVANLLDRGRMPQLAAAAEGRIEAAFLQPQPDQLVPRFEFERHLAQMTGAQPQWPESTRAISELRVSLRVRPNGLLAGLQGARTVHLDIVDYPGEWLLDLGLMDKSFAQWSAEVLTRIAGREEAAEYLGLLSVTEGTAALDEPKAQDLAAAFTEYLQSARQAGYSDCTPGRFLLPGDLAGSPVLTFAPLREAEKPARGSLWRVFEKRFEAYKAQVVKPFFRDHFARIDRQVVLVDALGAIHAGPQALEDLRGGLAGTLTAFRPGRNAWLTRLLGGKRVEKILFAATKADHLHHSQHPQLTAIMQALTREAADRAKFAGAQTEALSLASLRATVEESVPHDGATLDCVRGRLLADGRQAAFYPGTLPEDPTVLLHAAKTGAATWLDQDYQIMRFAPAANTLRPGEGPPHIRIDRAAQFLLGDVL
ncbi:YcjX family protein [Shimia sp. MMG029]|uniref:YcjX family protein n=1 Tax=Shimia sp. MMG029 TaxID=3021978 RepID=UPI0022FDFF8C|nr:YcjX family protein [Shimia sp. MMG029]MDA5557119.1 YcjX family protein [Shimia sp. MMG029]